jgi:hypothetical protein
MSLTGNSGKFMAKVFLAGMNKSTSSYHGADIFPDYLSLTELWQRF